MSASIQGGAAAATEGVDVSASRRPRSIRQIALREPTAIAGLAIIAFFVLVALLEPILVTGDPKSDRAACLSDESALRWVPVSTVSAASSSAALGSALGSGASAAKSSSTDTPSSWAKE